VTIARAQGQGIDYARIEILTEKIAPNLYMRSGSAGADPGHQDAPVAGSAYSPARTVAGGQRDERRAFRQDDVLQLTSVK
jgi:hypothetical protein